MPYLLIVSSRHHSVDGESNRSIDWDFVLAGFAYKVTLLDGTIVYKDGQFSDHPYSFPITWAKGQTRPSDHEELVS